MIIKYHEQSEEVEIHSDVHNVCDHEVEAGWECSCSDCRCETVIRVRAAYSFGGQRNHEVFIKTSGDFLVLPANAARALASVLCFAANDADQLDRDYPQD